MLLKSFLINLRDELALSVELDVTLVKASKKRTFMMFGNKVEHALTSVKVDVIDSGLSD